MQALDPMIVLSVENLQKSYGAITAVHDLSFKVGMGEVVGLVGSNGAGKTTTLRAICGLLQPSQGVIQLGGFEFARNPIECKKVFAYLPDNPEPYDFLTVGEHLQFTAMAFKVDNATEKIKSLLCEFELEEKAPLMASTLSRGMKQKLALACAFLRQPKLVILDEPLTGLDPRGIRAIKRSIRQRVEDGMSFLLSSHLLALLEEVCDSVLILHKGRKVALGCLEDLCRDAKLHSTSDLEEIFFALTENSAEPN